MEQKTFTKAMLDAGLRMPNETAGAFAAELRRLSSADREWFKERFSVEHNIEIITVK